MTRPLVRVSGCWGTEAKRCEEGCQSCGSRDVLSTRYERSDKVLPSLQDLRARLEA